MTHLPCFDPYHFIDTHKLVASSNQDAYLLLHSFSQFLCPQKVYETTVADREKDASVMSPCSNIGKMFDALNNINFTIDFPLRDRD